MNEEKVDIHLYCIMVKKLIYLTNTWFNISYIYGGGQQIPLPYPKVNFVIK
jgi:hypothetical protein